MLYTYPDYYEKFICTADKCSDTCCSGWQIVIDEKSLHRYKKGIDFPTLNMPDYVDFNEGVFKQHKDRRCFFLRDDNLCELCRQYGEEALCKTCHLYPRHIEEFENVRETTLSISCPEVCKIVLNNHEKVSFISKEDDKEEEYDDFDFLLYSTLLDAREVMIEIIQNRDIDIDTRAGMVLGLSHDIDKRLNDGDLFSTSDLLEYALSEKALKKSDEKVKKFTGDSNRLYSYMHRKFKKLFTLEPISYDWINLYTEAEFTLFRNGADYYKSWSEKFDTYVKNNMVDFDIKLEQLLLYFVYTYFCGAIYDSEIYGKGKLCVYSVYYIREFIKAMFIRNGGEISNEEIEDLALRYSRELEHSDENLTRIESF